mmetsp:Transcript_13457/g.28109  ORF Transcript_13457/g.28109 Transcript_13457/m.28109 type:complete len:1010 (-) Transcript_13457:333-3362(-)
MTPEPTSASKLLDLERPTPASTPLQTPRLIAPPALPFELDLLDRDFRRKFSEENESRSQASVSLHDMDTNFRRGTSQDLEGCEAHPLRTRSFHSIASLECTPPMLLRPQLKRSQSTPNWNLMPGMLFDPEHEPATPMRRSFTDDRIDNFKNFKVSSRTKSDADISNHAFDFDKLDSMEVFEGLDCPFDFDLLDAWDDNLRHQGLHTLNENSDADEHQNLMTRTPDIEPENDSNFSEQELSEPECIAQPKRTIKLKSEIVESDSDPESLKECFSEPECLVKTTPQTETFEFESDPESPEDSSSEPERITNMTPGPEVVESESNPELPFSEQIVKATSEPEVIYRPESAESASKQEFPEQAQLAVAEMELYKSTVQSVSTSSSWSEYLQVLEPVNLCQNSGYSEEEDNGVSEAPAISAGAWLMIPEETSALYVSTPVQMAGIPSPSSACRKVRNTQNLFPGPPVQAEEEFSSPLALAVASKPSTEQQFLRSSHRQSSAARVRSSSAPPKPSKCGSRVAIIVNGSRGDVQPIIALAKRLLQSGHTIRVLTNCDMASFCLQHGVDAVAVFADCQATLERIGGVSGRSISDPTQSACLKDAKKAATQWIKDNPGQCISTDDALEDFEPQAIFCVSQALGSGMRFETTYGVPVIFLFYQRDTLEFYGETLTEMQPSRPCFMCLSPAVDIQKPVKSPENLHITGALVLDERPSIEDVSEGGKLYKLKTFLDSGTPPVAIGWGSMTMRGMTPRCMLGLALRSLKGADRRGVVIGGWAKLHEVYEALLRGEVLAAELGPSHSLVALLMTPMEVSSLIAFAREKVFFVPEAPHAWLLPQCSCFIHHGGAGTTQAAIRAGIPAVVAPIFWDQFTFGRRVRALKAGVCYDKPLSKITSMELSKSIAVAETMGRTTERVRKKMSLEDGLSSTVSLFERFMRTEVNTRKWHKAFVAYHKKALSSPQAAPEETATARKATSQATAPSGKAISKAEDPAKAKRGAYKTGEHRTGAAHRAARSRQQ